MSFWDLDDFGSNLALVDEATGKSYAYHNLSKAIDIFRSYLVNCLGSKTLGFIFCKNTTAALVGYIGALQSKQTVCLLNANLHVLLRDRLQDLYLPDWIWLPKGLGLISGYILFREYLGYNFLLKHKSLDLEDNINPELALLLSTSGSTGSPKMVRLSYRNLQANAESIAAYLGLTYKDRPITTLPMEYSFGLSVINSHLQVGATLLLTDQSIVTREFWNLFKEQKATSIAGVPYTYQMLHRLNFGNISLPSLQIITQAGGHLDEKLQQYFMEVSQRKNFRFFIMYGQTEATARISYVPDDRIIEGIGSIGISIPGGRMEIDKESNELIYYGPNVMMGYAECRKDLMKGDELNGRLETGDLVRKGDNGFFYIIGRKKRFLKLLGMRINLDELERQINQQIPENCYCIGDDSKLILVVSDKSFVSGVKEIISRFYNFHPEAYKIMVLDNISYLPTGKVDYQALRDNLLHEF